MTNPANPRVSVLVMAYNHEQYIRDCLVSALLQCEDVDAEILVGDDCSTDRTSEIVGQLAEHHPAHIKHFRHAERLGPAGNYRFLSAQARGDYIAHLDGDDYWIPGKLRRQLTVLEAAPELVAAFTNAIAVDVGGKCLGLFNGNVASRLSCAELVRRGNFLNNSSMVFRREFHDEVLAPEGEMIDYRIHLRLARFGDFAYLNEVLAAYRVNSPSSLIRNDNERVRQLYWEALLDVPQERVSPWVHARGMAEFLRSIFFRSLRTGKPGLLRKWWPIVRSRSPVSSPILILLTTLSVMRSAVRIAGVVVARSSGASMPVLYRN